jgi:hypothetical protein
VTFFSLSHPLLKSRNFFLFLKKEFYRNLERKYIENEAQDPSRTPEEFAASYVTASFPSPIDVLDATRKLLARDLAFHPGVRKHVRSLFMTYAQVSTEPTAEGKKIIDGFHPLRGVKRLQNKPMTAFVTNSDQFLRFVGRKRRKRRKRWKISEERQVREGGRRREVEGGGRRRKEEEGGRGRREEGRRMKNEEGRRKE